MKRSIIAGNWKMNKNPNDGSSFINDVIGNLSEVENVEVVFCPPFTGLNNINIKPPYYLGAQNCYYKDNGAYTGEISLIMLLECNVQYIIIGHSERRIYHSENSLLLKKKIQSVLNAGLTPIYCVGENFDIKKKGKTKNHLLHQLSKFQRYFKISVLVINFRAFLKFQCGFSRYRISVIFQVGHTI